MLCSGCPRGCYDKENEYRRFNKMARCEATDPVRVEWSSKNQLHYKIIMDLRPSVQTNPQKRFR